MSVCRLQVDLWRGGDNVGKAREWPADGHRDEAGLGMGPGASPAQMTCLIWLVGSGLPILHTSRSTCLTSAYSTSCKLLRAHERIQRDPAPCPWLQTSPRCCNEHQHSESWAGPQGARPGRGSSSPVSPKNVRIFTGTECCLRITMLRAALAVHGSSGMWWEHHLLRATWLPRRA